MRSLQTAAEIFIEVTVLVGAYMKWIRPTVDRLLGIDVPPSCLDSPEQKRKGGSWRGPL